MDRLHLIDSIANALRESGKPVLRADHVARVLGCPVDVLMSRLDLLEQMEKAGLEHNPVQRIPWNRRKAYGVDFDKIVYRTVKVGDKAIREYHPGIMLRSQEQTLRLEAIRSDSAKLVALQGVDMEMPDGTEASDFLSQYDISFNLNGIMLTRRNVNVTETADKEPEPELDE